MAYSQISSAALRDDLAGNAMQFSLALQDVAQAINADLSQAIRKGVMDLFRAIVKRSPVDTGAYRASHGIANMDPAGTEDIVQGKKGREIPADVALAKLGSWTWKVGDGDIFIYNNLPYAERIENGWSKQAPAGVYRVSLAEMTQHLNQILSSFKGTLEPGGEQ